MGAWLLAAHVPSGRKRRRSHRQRGSMPRPQVYLHSTQCRASRQRFRRFCSVSVSPPPPLSCPAAVQSPHRAAHHLRCLARPSIAPAKRHHNQARIRRRQPAVSTTTRPSRFPDCAPPPLRAATVCISPSCRHAPDASSLAGLPAPTVPCYFIASPAVAVTSSPPSRPLDHHLNSTPLPGR